MCNTYVSTYEYPDMGKCSHATWQRHKLTQGSYRRHGEARLLTGPPARARQGFFRTEGVSYPAEFSETAYNGPNFPGTQIFPSTTTYVLVAFFRVCTDILESML